MKKITFVLAILLLCLIPFSIAGAADGGKMYGIGSVSKVFTAAAVMKLVEAGQVDLDEPVVTYIPEFEMADARYVNITPRMLLNHSSGLMGSTFRSGWLLGDNDSSYHDHILEYMKSARLKHDPGDRSIYCNDGLTLAEILIERVSGVSFTEFIEREFTARMGLENIKTPQSEFDRSLLADIYLGNNALQPECTGVIGSGGIYATVEDLCRYATIFMDDADGSVLSALSVNEMATNRIETEPAHPDTETTHRYGSYGLGWDFVDAYPFNLLGIKALSKGGGTIAYHTNLTVLPEYNIAAAVTSSGGDSLESIIAQEIILAVLIEEGLIPPDTALTLPELNLERALIPDSIKAKAGIYDTGFMGEMLQVSFTDDSLIIAPFASRNERVQEFIYNTDGVFVSIDGNYIGYLPSFDSAYGISRLTFEGKYLVAQSYMDVQGLGQTDLSAPFAEKLEANPVPADAASAWEARNAKEYLLVSEKHTSVQYISAPYARTLTDARAPGYVTGGVYQYGEGNGALLPTARIVDASHAEAFLTIPIMNGRDGIDLAVSMKNGVEYLNLNAGDSIYMDASSASKFSELGGAVAIVTDTVWADIDADLSGQVIYIEPPQNGAWFAYDDNMNCIATSLEKYPRSSIILPENGRMAFAGQPGARFVFTIA